MRESRRFQRKKMNGSVKVIMNGGIDLGKIRDISRGGLSVATSTPYRLGYELFLEVEVSEASDSITALAEVVWVNPLEASFHPTGMGLKFLDLKEEDFYKLDRILMGP
jgi:uncharacterized protein (TIGR02266 family)